MKRNYYWFCQLFGWFFFGVYDLSTLYFRDRLTLQEIQFTSVFLIYCVFITEIYHFIIKKYKWDQLLIEKLVLRVAISVTILTVLINAFVVLIGIMYREKVSFKLEFAIGFLFYSFALSMLWSTFYFLWKYINSNKELELERIKMQMTMKDLELKNIKSNLQPHFIFNALNSIRSLITENQEKARDAVMQLSNILRNSLISDKAELVKLEKELSIVKDYLNLESIRYEERLVVNYTIDKNCLQSLVPPLLLQTLVENAIKHGVGVSPDGGFINFNVSDFNNTKTIIKIENTGDYNLKNNIEGGFGLESSIKRLFYLFGNYASLTISNSTKNSVITILEIPK